MICPRYGSSVCGPHCSLVTAEIFAMYTQSEPIFMSFCPVAQWGGEIFEGVFFFSNHVHL